VPLYGDLWVSDASKESLVQVWQTIITRTGLQVRTGCRVESVKYEHGHFVVRAGEQVFRARRVVLALGRRGNPRKLGVPGEELGHVFYDIVEMEAFAGRNVLVVGGGDSAVESALGLANQDGTKVTLSYRGKEFGRVKDRNRAKIDAAVKSGQVRLMLESETKVIRAGQTVLTTTAGEVTVPADDVIVRVGGEAPYPFIERCGVRIVKKSLAVESSGSERKTG
jgi:thioredoxin reductase